MSRRDTPVKHGAAPRLHGLESTLSRFARRGPAPVHLWEPAHCGDIGLFIGGDGTWYYRDSPIGRKALVRLFSTVLRKDADGRHYLVTPAEKIVVGVADAPFLAVEMTVTGSGPRQTLTFRTNCDDEVEANAGHPLRFERQRDTGGVKPYLLVRGALEALVTRAVAYDLVDLAVSHGGEESGAFGVWSGGAFFPIGAGSDTEPV